MKKCYTLHSSADKVVTGGFRSPPLTPPVLCTPNAPSFPQIPPAGSCHSRLSQLVGWCDGDTPSNAPFGVNPHFLSTSSLYDPTLLSNKTQLDNSSFGFKLVYNPQGLPYGFIYPRVRIASANTSYNPRATSYQAIKKYLHTGSLPLAMLHLVASHSPPTVYIFSCVHGSLSIGVPGRCRCDVIRCSEFIPFHFIHPHSVTPRLWNGLLAHWPSSVVLGIA